MQLTHLDAIARHYDTVVISPHFDDAAASCGGRIVDRIKLGEKVLVVTVFTSRNTGEKPYRKKSAGKLLDYDQRRAEDKAAMELLGVDFIWLGYREFLFRESIPLFRYWPCYRETPSNSTLSQALSSDFLDICRKAGCNRLVLPMAVGQHMDHQVVFQAGIHLLRKKMHPYRIIFYEDYPYILYPYMRYYRMKITGWLRMMPKSKNDIFKPVQSSAYRDAVELLSGTPSFKLGPDIIKPLYFLPILIFGLYTQYLMKTRRNILDKGWLFLQEAYDISHTIDQKLDAIMAYRSQLAGTVLKRKRIKDAMSTYSEFIGFPKGRFCERYLKLSPVHMKH
jgi:LmbE family N-acetylglucosaminyl deacetylase